MMIGRRRLPQYDPSTDATLAIWCDARDSGTSSIQNLSGNSPANGDTIKQWSSKAGTARKFQQSARADNRPTYDTSGINGKAAVRFAGAVTPQILVADVVTGFQSMSGFTIAMVAKQNTDTGANNCAFGVTIGTGTSLILSECTAHYRVGGRRVLADSFQFAENKTLSAGQAYIQTGIFDFSAATLTLYEDGVRGILNQTFQASGTTAASDPASISLGARYESVLTQLAIDGWLGEFLIWAGAKTEDFLAGVHTYLRLGWLIG
jgi:hypothetical protein